jgi:GTP-binding protein
MDYRQARFLQSAPTRSLLPPDTGIEVAFSGRSNAGKTSALNALTGQSGLARTSKTPGRTQLINLFALDDARRLVDLPGYGYAKVSHSLRDEWQQHLADYLMHRKALRGIVLLMDIRHPFTEHDEVLLALAKQQRKPVHCVLTKADKLKFGARKTALLSARKQLAELPELSVQLLSSTEKFGLEELSAKLDEWFGA